VVDRHGGELREELTPTEHGTPMSDLLDEILEAIFGEATGDLVDNAPTWVLCVAFLAAVGLTVFFFAAVHWSLGMLGTVASLCLGGLWVLKLRSR
jgi:hypothetical protein